MAESTKKKKNITLKNIPDEVYEKLIQLKTDVMTRTKRGQVSYEEVIFKLIRNAK
jgi:predicted CopG family antitoxin